MLSFLQMTKDAKFFSNFDVAIITECYRKEDIEKLNLLCREANTQFFAGNVFGFFGYFFEDLGLHCYEQEIQKVLDAKKVICMQHFLPLTQSSFE